jgi:capsid protein
MDLSPSKNAIFPGLTYQHVASYSFNGEKNFGQAGPMIDYTLDTNGLRIRSWQAMLESDKAQIGIGRLLKWVIGTGLKPQCEPSVSVLEQYGIKLDKKKYAKQVEELWNLWRRSKSCDYSGMKNMNQIDLESEKNSMVGGDVLIIIRYIKGQQKIQLIDGAHVQSPYYGSEFFPKALANGNTIIDGVEINSRREHIAYYVRTYALNADISNIFEYKFERIEARGKDGLLRAWFHYGNEFRINNVRGMSIYAACLEKLKQMEEYSGATLSQAKEAAKVSYQVEHELNASGKAPFATAAVEGFSSGIGMNGNNRLPITDDGITMGKVMQITNIGTAYNNNPGSKISMLKNENPLYFKEFMETHTNEFCAVIDIPPNVFWGLYTNSFSASRASIVDLIHTLANKREHHYVGHKKPIFDFWLHTEILKGNIQAPGYIMAFNDGNEMVLEAYRSVRFVGKNPGHIDPEKEANAVRVMLGPAMANMPLIDGENAAEVLGTGDITEIIEQSAIERDMTEKLGLKPAPIEQKVVNDSTITKKGGKKKPKPPVK